jgi:hypothetical protein
LRPELFTPSAYGAGLQKVVKKPEREAKFASMPRVLRMKGKTGWTNANSQPVNHRWRRSFATERALGARRSCGVWPIWPSTAVLLTAVSESGALARAGKASGVRADATRAKLGGLEVD